MKILRVIISFVILSLALNSCISQSNTSQPVYRGDFSEVIFPAPVQLIPHELTSPKLYKPLIEPVTVRLAAPLRYVPEVVEPKPIPYTYLDAEFNVNAPALYTQTYKGTGYNSLPNQTDDTPFITATGHRTMIGVIAVSRDLLPKHEDEKVRLPYGTLVRITDLSGGGEFDWMIKGRLFRVEDTMHTRWRDKIDIWFPEYNQAINWGSRNIKVEVVRFGR